MANIKGRIKSTRASTKRKGRARVKKSLTVGKVAQKSVTNKLCELLTADASSHVQISNVSRKSSESSIASQGIITRSGRIRKKCKEKLKIMDNILKTELLIEDRRKSKQRSLKNVNNNDIILTDQNSCSATKPNNVDGVSELQNGQSKSQKAARLKVKSKTKINSTVDNSFGVAQNGRNIKELDESTRVNVLNNMKNVLSTDGDLLPQNDTKKYVKKRAKSTKNDKTVKVCSTGKRKTENDDLEKADAKASKMKQVTLSNGLVLTLCLAQCDYCQKSFSNKSSLSRHMLTHVDSRPHVCPHCPRKFRYMSTLRVHQKRQHATLESAPEYYTCQICDKAFLMQENLQLHLASHVKAENKFQCLYCDKKFSYRLLLTQHEKTHLVTGEFKCYLCHMTYNCRSRLKHHIKTHSKIKEYICQFCGKEYLRLWSIKRHVQVSHGGQRIQCPICFKVLKGHLSEHMRLHGQNRPHVCPECGQRFTQATQLTVHRRSHSGVRPYSCRICLRPFTHANALMLHIRRHTGERPYTCALCPITFSQIPHMKAHMRKIHGKDRAYKCKKCEEFFKLKCDLDTHVSMCKVGDRELSFEEQIQASVQIEDVEVESNMPISKMRFLLALLLTMIASKDKLNILGFNKRLIDDLLIESLEAMGQKPCKEKSLSPINRLRANIEILLEGTIPTDQMDRFKSENKSVEDLLVLLTDDKKGLKVSTSA